MPYLCWILLGLVLALGSEGFAAGEQKASFALIIGVNKSLDGELRQLRYADDDAVRYFDLFRSLGHRTYLLTRPDKNTRRLHPQAVAEAYPPRRAALEQVVRLLSADVTKARKRGVRTILYLVFAGHGNIKEGKGYLGLEDHRLTSRRLRADVLDRLRADQSHLIIDACHSFFLAHSRGPGGSRRRLHGFSRMGQALADGQIGLLLSTSAMRESHEWAAFQAGVFSHEVRSGLYGAADADGNGRVSYREIAAFVHRANASIPNERFRPKVYARPPRSGDVLLDIRQNRKRQLEIGPAHSGRYLLETAEGVRLVDFHSSPRQRLRLLRPPSAGRLYLHRLSDEREFVIPPGPALVKIASLVPGDPRTAPRGAAHHAFSKVFAMPYDQKVVASFDMALVSVLAGHLDAQPVGGTAWRRTVGWVSLGTGAAALAGGIYLTASAMGLRDDIQTHWSNERTVAVNGDIHRRNIGAVVLYSVAGAALAGGLLALLWPDGADAASFSVSPGGATVALGGRW